MIRSGMQGVPRQAPSLARHAAHRSAGTRRPEGTAARKGGDQSELRGQLRPDVRLRRVTRVR